MASSLNKVMLMGNITRDIELRHTAGNMAVAKLGIATNRKWKTPEGETREEVMFIDCEAWGKTAEVINQYFSKGRPILIEGRLKLDQWEDKETKAKRSKHVVVIDAFHFVDSKPGGGGGSDMEEGGGQSRSSGGGNWGPRQNAPAPRQSAPAPAARPSAPAAPPMGDDDIPF
ncbi:MAG TPA: single-stranded DNA-binding protein [Phycisphaerales bacterium]|nr:single-stranded DNA-binding protein [Phycisphaerales bacterium]